MLNPSSCERTAASTSTARAPTTAITGTRGTFRVAGQPGDYLALNVDGADFTNGFFGEFFGSIERVSQDTQCNRDA